MSKPKITAYGHSPNRLTKFSVIIPTLWKSDKIYEMLDIYEGCKYVDEVIIIDNDPSKNIKITHSKVKIISKGHNIFVNPAWNFGVATATHEHIIIANDDIIIKKLDKLLSKLQNTNYDLVGVDWDNTRTDDKINIVESDKLRYGFGCFMFVKKSKYIQLPYDLKIWRGDFLLHKHLKSGKFSGVYLETNMSETVNSFKGKASEDTYLYRRWKRPEKDLTMVLITYNRLAYTKKCIESFKKHTRCKYFIIIIDNGSTDGTREYLQKLSSDNIMIVLSEENLMPRRSNQLGLQLSFPSKNYLLCDNDGEFTKGWYEKSLKVALEADIACLRKSRWLPIQKFHTSRNVNGVACYETRYIGSFTIMNKEMRQLLIEKMKGEWIGVQIGSIAISNHKLCVQVKDGYILDQSDNDMNNPEYREQYIELWRKKRRLNAFERRINILNLEQNANRTFELKQNYNNTSRISINKEKQIVIKEVVCEDAKELISREEYWLSKLQDTGFVPKILDVIDNKIILEYCGEVLDDSNKPIDLYEQLYNINIELLKNHCYYNDWKKGNILVKGAKVYLIDFGWCPYILEDYSCHANVNTERTQKKSGNYFNKII